MLDLGGPVLDPVLEVEVERAKLLLELPPPLDFASAKRKQPGDCYQAQDYAGGKRDAGDPCLPFEVQALVPVFALLGRQDRCNLVPDLVHQLQAKQQVMARRLQIRPLGDEPA